MRACALVSQNESCGNSAKKVRTDFGVKEFTKMSTLKLCKLFSEAGCIWKEKGQVAEANVNELQAAFVCNPRK